jgi:N6-adenosine-specific RNA methylase IME4
MIPTIDPEFSALIPPLALDELAQLEANILRDGCREPLTVWRGLLLDGHNRLSICQRHGLKFETVYVELAGRDEAADWIDRNQLGRRNLSPDQASLLRGRRYNRTKTTGHGSKSAYQNDPQNRDTADRLAVEHGVSAPTIKRDGQYAAAVEKVATLDPDLARKVATGQAPPKSSVIQAAKLLDTQPEIAASILAGDTDLKQAVRSINREEKIAAIVANNLPLDGALGKFSVIYADPPWRYDHPISDSRKIENQYPTMDIDDICALPVPDICAEDTILFLWASTPMLKKGLQVMEAWGFEYRTSMVWVKPSIGPGQWVRQRHELLLIGIKGDIPTPRGADKPDSVIEAPRQEHSKKPDVMYEIIEQMYPELARVELFCRAPREGWSVWGNQA